MFSQPDLELVSVLGSIIFQSSSFSNQSTTTKSSIEVKGTTGLGGCPFKRPLSVFCCQPSGVLSMALSIAFAIVGACSDARGLIYIKKKISAALMLLLFSVLTHPVRAKLAQYAIMVLQSLSSSFVILPEDVTGGE